MSNLGKSIIYIDGANLHKGSLELNKKIDYKKLRGWLRQKYEAEKIYLFIGLVPKYSKLYLKLQEYGYILIFKETVMNGIGEVKGNCDAELVLKVTSDFYENRTNNFVIVSGDGDFGCLIEFLIEKSKNVLILPPNKDKCSFLLRRTKAKISPLDNHYHKFFINDK
ncbi:NYN domain-containing protein [Patescibacteria group bacterium]|nr:NYN domain-containing protein [Patescibacteria group bacterium]